MRAAFEKIVRSWFFATPNAAGETINHPLREIATVLGGRDAGVLGFKLLVRADLAHEEQGDVDVPTRYGLRGLHGRISLIGPAGTGLVPQALWGDEIAALNVGQCGACALNAGFLGGTFAEDTVPAAETLEVESTLPIYYAQRAQSAGTHGKAGIYDGMIDAALFGASTTLQIDGLGAVMTVPSGEGTADVTPSNVRLDLVAVYANQEPGEHKGPTQTQYRRLGLIDQDPRTFGLGRRMDVQSIVLSCDPDEDLLWVWDRNTQGQVHLDGVAVLNEPVSLIGRAGFDRGLVGSVLTRANANGGWVPILSPNAVPQASQRHPASVVELHGMLADGDEDEVQPMVLAVVNMPPDFGYLDEWARKRGVDLSKGGKVGDGAPLTDDQALGIAPTFK